MSLDLILTRDCPPRETLSNGQLTTVSTAMMFLEDLHHETALEPGAVEPPADDIKLSDGESSLRIEELRERVRSAWVHLGACVGCPLNVTGRLVGCHVRVDYPIDGATERAVADAAARASEDDQLVVNSVLSRTPVSRPTFREPSAGMFEAPYAPYVEVPWEGQTKGVSLDAFWDLVLEPRSSEDGLAVATVLTQLHHDLAAAEELDDASETIHQLLTFGFALRVVMASEIDSGFAISG